MQHTVKDLKSAFPKANGAFAIKMPAWGLGIDLAFVGGPFVRNVPEHSNETFGVCLVERIPADVRFDGIHMPIPDFSVPQEPVEEVLKGVQMAIIEAMRGKEVFVGCLGGWGRTGIFLSLIAKVLGQEKPVEYIRRHYTERAVETPEQYKYVMDFPVPDNNMWFLKIALSVRTQMLWDDAKLSIEIGKDYERQTGNSVLVGSAADELDYMRAPQVEHDFMADDPMEGEDYKCDKCDNCGETAQDGSGICITCGQENEAPVYDKDPITGAYI